MISDKRGLSTVVTTLIIILLVLVAIGIVWFVVKPIIEGGAEQTGVLAKCLNVDVGITKMTFVATPTAGYKATIERKDTNSDAEIGGIKAIFINEAGTRGTNLVNVYTGNIEPLNTIESALLTNLGIPQGSGNPTSAEVYVYFVVDGVEKLCQNAIKSEGIQILP